MSRQPVLFLSHGAPPFAHPTPEHFLPLLVAAGAAREDDPVETLEGGMTYGGLSMDSCLFGAQAEARS